MLVNIGDLVTIKDFLQSEFMKNDNPEVCIKLAACKELLDLLPYNSNGYQLHYDSELVVIQSKGKLEKNEIFY